MEFRNPRRAALAALLLAGLPALAAAEGLWAVRDGNEIVRFDTATPGTLTTVAVTGLAGGETLVGIDFRPADGKLYGITDQGRIYTIAPTTGAATLASTASTLPSGAVFGVDFNPVADRLRVISDTEQNLRIDVVAGTATVDTALGYAVTDPNFLVDPSATACAYTNSVGGATATTLYVIDTAADALAIQSPPNNGTLNTVGALGVNADGVGGFDISPAGSTAYAALRVSASTLLYRIDLATGAATSLGAIGNAADVRGLAVEPPAPGPAVDAFGVTAAGSLFSFRTVAPITSTTIGTVTGLDNGETLVGIDFRPADGKLYGLGSAGRLYTINTTTAAATFVVALQTPLDGIDFGVDFNPVVDRLRLVSNADSNVRVNPADGVVTPDTALTYGVGDVNAAANPAVVGVAYTNDLAGATATSLYGIDAGTDALVLQNPPNAGVLGTVGRLGYDVGPKSSFDIARADNVAFAALTPEAGTSTLLYSVDLTTGAATLRGPIGGGVLVTAIAIAPLARLDAAQLNLKFNYKKTGNDSVALKGTFPAPAVSLAGLTVTFEIGGVTQGFVLDAKGKARTGDDTFAFEGKPKNGVVKYAIQLKKDTFADDFADEGMGGTADAKKEARTLLVRLTVGGVTREAIVTLEYTAKAGKSGTAKLAR